MAKNKLTKEDIKQLKHIIAKYIYKKEGLDKIQEEKVELEKTIKQNIETTYYALFDFSKENIELKAYTHLFNGNIKKEDVKGIELIMNQAKRQEGSKF